MILNEEDKKSYKEYCENFEKRLDEIQRDNELEVEVKELNEELKR